MARLTSTFPLVHPATLLANGRWGSSFICVALLSLLGPVAWGSQKTLQDVDGAASSKKGLQVQMVDDALALGVHHAALNVNFGQLLAVEPSDKNESLTLDGHRFEFTRTYVDWLDGKIRPLSSHGVTVYLILLAYKAPLPKLPPNLLHPKYDPASKAPISAFNTADADGARQFQACAQFLARRYAVPTIPPVHFIVGNEVNSHWFWYNMGAVPMDAVVSEYERTVRLCHNAVHATAPASRIFVSLDHNWNTGVTPNEPLKSFGAHAFLESFAKLAKSRGDFEWHLAFHPYPENLFEARTWNDAHATMALDTPKITFKNIALLNDFMKRPELTFNGKPRRIILSEQGFHSTAAPDGELIQAAAFAYSYRKVEGLDGIDAFILHRHVDHRHEGGLNLGLWTCDQASKPVKKKMIYDVFRLADTKEWEAAFKFALPVIGVHGWGEIK